jgi:hypothetical protein
MGIDLAEIIVLNLLASFSGAFAWQLHDGWNLPKVPRAGGSSGTLRMIMRTVKSIFSPSATAERCCICQYVFVDSRASFSVLLP